MTDDKERLVERVPNMRAYLAMVERTPWLFPHRAAALRSLSNPSKAS